MTGQGWRGDDGQNPDHTSRRPGRAERGVRVAAGRLAGMAREDLIGPCPRPSAAWMLSIGGMAWRCQDCGARWRIVVDGARLVWSRQSWRARAWLWVLDRIGARLV